MSKAIELNEEQKKSLMQRSKDHHTEELRKARKLVEAHAPLLNASDSYFQGKGDVKYVVDGISYLKFDMNFSEFSGSLSFYGIDTSGGYGGWEGTGYATFSVIPEDLSGKGTVKVIAGGDGNKGAFTLNCYNDNGIYFGNITGVSQGFGIASSTIGGTFTWTKNE